MRIMSIQSAVTYGHVGNSAAVFPLQRAGHEVMPVYTVMFSNSTAYGDWEGPMLTGQEVHDIVAGIDRRGALNDTQLVLSGYQGGFDIGDAILEAVALTKERNPQALYACDPVLGSHETGCHVSSEVQELIRDRVVPQADIITPNQFELGFLTNTNPQSLEEILQSVELVRAQGPSVVLVTSVSTPDMPENTISMLVITDDGVWMTETPRLPFQANGSGDVTAALFSSTFVATGNPALALERTAASVFELLENTYNSGQRELLLIESQEAYAHPKYSFSASKIL